MLRQTTSSRRNTRSSRVQPQRRSALVEAVTKSNDEKDSDDNDNEAPDNNEVLDDNESDDNESVVVEKKTPRKKIARSPRTPIRSKLVVLKKPNKAEFTYTKKRDDGNDDSSESEYTETTKKTRVASRKKKATQRKKAAKRNNKDSGSGSEYHSASENSSASSQDERPSGEGIGDSDSEYASDDNKPLSSLRKKRPRRRRVRQQISSGEESASSSHDEATATEAKPDDGDSSDDDKPPPSSLRKKRTQRILQDDSKEESEDSKATPTKARTSRSSAKQRATPKPRSRQYESSSSDDDDASSAQAQAASSPSRPQRDSARKAGRKIKAVASTHHEDSDEYPQIRKHEDSDDDFEQVEQEDNDDDEVLSADESSPSEDDAHVRGSKRNRPKRGGPTATYWGDAVGVVDDDEQIGSAESSDDGKRTRKKKAAVGVVKDDDKIGSVESSGDETRRNKAAGSIRNRKSALELDSESEDDDMVPMRSPQKIVCPSTQDVITGEDLPPLPQPHVCFITPDGSGRQCFALETLRKIALTSPRPSFRTDHAGQEHANFLQPPHFRTPMADEVLDQIASRFGRDALNIHGEYYQRKQTEEQQPASWDDAYRIVPSVQESSGQLIEQLHRYMRSSMGQQDVYVCPVCYIACHAQLDHVDSTTEPALPTTTDFSWDPMSVLGHLDQDEFRTASVFCYKKVAQLKVHLRQDHGVDTKPVQGNDAYVRYKIRGQDGLLQRFLRKSAGKKWTTRQGEMMRYWSFGNNTNFLLLLSHVTHADYCRRCILEQNDDEDEVEAAKEFLHPGTDFFEEMAPEDVQSIWTMVSSPFCRATKEDMGDFVADDEEEEEEGDDDAEGVDPLSTLRAMQMQAELAEFDRERSVDEQKVERYESLERQRQGDEEEDEENGSDAEQHSLQKEQSSSSEESEPFPGATSSRLTPQKRRRRRSVLSDDSSAEEEEHAQALTLSAASKTRKRLVIADSDDEDS